MTEITPPTIKAIITEYNGYRFRSRLEARWAIFFDALDLKYQYEPEGYEIGDIKYLPDFYLPDLDIFVEIKPSAPPLDELRKVQAFADYKQIVLIMGQPGATFDQYGAGVSIEYVASRYMPLLGPEKEHALWDSPSVFIQCRDCERVGLESRGYHFDEFADKDFRNHGAYSGFCCSEKNGRASSGKLIAAYDKAKGYAFW